MKLIKVIIPILAVIGVIVSIVYMGKYNDLWSLIFCWFCLGIIFWWYLANVVFTTSKRERRNLAYRKVVKRKNDSWGKYKEVQERKRIKTDRAW